MCPVSGTTQQPSTQVQGSLVAMTRRRVPRCATKCGRLARSALHRLCEECWIQLNAEPEGHIIDRIKRWFDQHDVGYWLIIVLVLVVIIYSIATPVVCTGGNPINQECYASDEIP